MALAQFVSLDGAAVGAWEKPTPLGDVEEGRFVGESDVGADVGVAVVAHGIVGKDGVLHVDGLLPPPRMQAYSAAKSASEHTVVEFKAAKSVTESSRAKHAPLLPHAADSDGHIAAASHAVVGAGVGIDVGEVVATVGDVVVGAKVPTAGEAVVGAAVGAIDDGAVVGTVVGTSVPAQLKLGNCGSAHRADIFPPLRTHKYKLVKSGSPHT